MSWRSVSHLIIWAPRHPSITILSITVKGLHTLEDKYYAERRYTECHCAKCHGAHCFSFNPMGTMTSSKTIPSVMIKRLHTKQDECFAECQYAKCH